MSGSTDPFGQSRRRADQFLTNLYGSFLMVEVMEKHEKLKDEFIEAFLNQDNDLMKRKQDQIDECAASLEITGILLGIANELDS
jgi:hypothetical protein